MHSTDVSPRLKAIGVLILIVFLAVTITSAVTERPAVDEGTFADPALNLYRNHSMGSLFLPDHNLKGIHQRTYWIHPLHIVAQAGWYHLVGFSIVKMRGMSMLFGMAAIFAWFVIAKSLFKDNLLAMVVAVLVASDYYFLVASAWGRMDMMTASLGFCGYAFYLAFREKKLTLAIFGSHCFLMLSGLTHPMAVLHFAGLLVMTVGLDRGKLRPVHLAVAAFSTPARKSIVSHPNGSMGGIVRSSGIPGRAEDVSLSDSFHPIPRGLSRTVDL
jgi:4-amino-4-deoxy-L-arabinose transferase-like glycosyltransferase